MKRVISLIFVLAMLFLAGCGGDTTESSVKFDVAQVYTALEKTLPDMVAMDAEMMLNFCGIDTADCAQAVVYVSSDGLLADEIWLIEAKDADALKRLETLAKNRLERKGEESITYSPEQYKVVQNAQLLLNGNYLALIVSPDVDTLVKDYRAAAGIQ